MTDELNREELQAMAETPAAKPLTYFQTRLNRLIEMNKDRDSFFDAVDAMDHGVWEEPEEFADIPWVEAFPSTEQHDVLMAGARIVSDNNPRFRMLPRSIEGGSEDKTDMYERGIKSLFMQSDRRREATVLKDAGFSALKYAEVAISVHFLPELIRSAKAIGGNTTRYEALKRNGDFVVTVNNPRQVYARYSDLGVEEVGHRKEMDPYEVIDLFGEEALPTLAAALDNLQEGERIDSVTFNDYFNYKARAVWVTWKSTSADATSTEEIYRNKWPYPFLPWACKIVGTSTESRPEYRRRNLLYTSHHFELYDLMNRVRSLRYSEMVRYAGRSRTVLFTDEDVDPEIDPSSPDFMMIIRSLEAKMQEISPNMPDPSMGVLHQELRQDLESSSLSKILMGAQPPPQAAFSTINLVTHSALAVLRPFIDMLEIAMAEVATIMMLWLHYSPASNEIIVEGMQDEDFGREYKMRADDILPNRLMVICELSDDVPTDRQAQALTAMNLQDRRIISKREAMTEVGVTDVAAMEAQIVQEQLEDTELQIAIKNRMMMADQQVQEQMLQRALLMIQEQMKQQMQQQQMQAQTAQQGLPVERGGRSLMGPNEMPPQLPGQQGIEGVEGSLVNPNEGGTPPAVFSPYQTREQQTLQDRMGQDLASV